MHTTEETMFEQMKAVDNKFHRKDKMHHEYEKQPTKQKFEKRKFCKFHKSHTHSDEECNAQKDKSPNSEISVPKATSQCIVMDGKLKDSDAKILLDTGSVHNYINEKFATNTALKHVNIPKCFAEMANGSKLEINKEVIGDLQLQADTSKRYQVNMRIMPKLSTHIVLGMDFMLSNEVVIDLKENILTVDGKNFEILENTSMNKDQERFISEKTNMMNIETSKEKAENLIKRYKIKNKELGIIPQTQHKISLVDQIPIFCKPYPIPHAIINDTRKEIERLINLGIIRESKSPYCSPAFPLKKKNGDIRLVIDYRKLNKKTIPMNFPIPRINDYLQELGGSKIFSQINLNMGYYQVKMCPEDISKTAFSLDRGHYEFLRMPFGFSNALALSKKLQSFPVFFNNLFKIFNNLFKNFNNNII
jgi:hypothetical protein